MNYRVLVTGILLCAPVLVSAAGNNVASAAKDAHSSTNNDAHQSSLQKELARENAAEHEEMQEERHEEQAERNREAAELARERASEKKEMHEEHEQLRAELKREAAAANRTGDEHDMKSADKLVNKLIDKLTAMSDNSGSQYMNQYAGSYQHYGDYQQYEKKYAGAYQKYQNKYAGEYQQYADYQKYIQRYSKENNEKLQGDAVQSARDANTTGQLDKWKDASRQNVQWYVPAEYNAYAKQHINKQYNRRLHELQNSANANDAGGITAKDVADSAVNLAETPEHKEHKQHLNATQREALKKKECEQLRQVSEEGVKKVQDLSKSLKRSASNSKALEATSAAASQNVANAFSDRTQAVQKNVELLETQVKSGQTGADFANQVEKAKGDVTKLRDDELHALGQAHRDASDSARHAARGAQDTARDQARHVQAVSDKMARKDQSYQDQANKLQDDVEAAADDAENNGEDLEGRTQDLLDDHVSTARQEVHKAADRRLDTLREVQTQFETLEANEETKAKSAKESEANEETKAKSAKESVSFLAQSLDFGTSSPAPLAVLGLVGVTFACLAFWLLFFAKYNVLLLGGNPIDTPPLLG
jgi:hypothetical protein